MALRTDVDVALDAAGLDSAGYIEIGHGSWPSTFAVSDLAVASIGAACAGYAAPFRVALR